MTIKGEPKSMMDLLCAGLQEAIDNQLLEGDNYSILPNVDNANKNFTDFLAAKVPEDLHDEIMTQYYYATDIHDREYLKAGLCTRLAIEKETNQ